MFRAYLLTIAVTDTLSTTAEVLFGEAKYALVYVPAGSTITSLTFYAAPARAGTHLALYDTDGNAVIVTVAAGRVYPVPSACQGAGAIKMVGDADGSVQVSWQG